MTFANTQKTSNVHNFDDNNNNKEKKGKENHLQNNS